MDFEQFVESNRTDSAYTRISNNLKEQFEKFLGPRHDFLKDNEEKIKETFKELYDMEENNPFLDFAVEDLENEIKAKIISRNEINLRQQPELRSIIKKVSDYCANNITNIEANLNTLENFSTIEQYYAQIKKELVSIAGQLRQIESDFNASSSFSELAAPFERL